MSMRNAVDQPVDAPASRSHLWTLLALAVAISCWVVGDDWRAEVPALRQQLGTAARVVARGSGAELDQSRSAARQVAAERAGLERRLQSDDTEQIVRAKLIYDLRRICVETAAAGCIVRLADDAVAGRSGTGASNASDAEATLDSLGVRRARALVSGSFVGDEPVRLIEALTADANMVWRVNGVVIKGNTFELDVERHIRPATKATGS